VAAAVRFLAGVIAAADRIEGKIGDNLRKALPWLPTAKNS